MSLSSSVKYLSERGVSVERVWTNRYSLRVEGRRQSTLEERDGLYAFSCWECTPGPGPADFSVAFADLNEALLAIWYFYFGEPVRIGEWQIPMHSNPDWSLGQVAFRIASAFHVTRAQFEAIAEARRDRFAGTLCEGRYEVAMRSQFIACPSALEPSHTLMLRRDLEEAYLVTRIAG